MRWSRNVTGLVLLALLASWRFPLSAADPTYWQDVRPILRRHCTACHSNRTIAVAPPEVVGKGANGKLELALAVGPLAPVAAVTFSPDGKLLAAGSYGRVTLWSLAGARPVRVLTNVLGAVNDLRFSPDGKLL